MKTVHALFTLVLALPLCCQSTRPLDLIAISEPKSYPPATPGSVVFKLRPLPSTAPGAQQWQASYSSRGKTARFRIEFDNSQKKDKSDVAAISVGKGRLFSEPGSDASTMIIDLQRALEAKHLPTKVRRESSVPFTYVNFGEHQTRFSDDSFGPNPPGNWTAIKIFLETGDEESEVFLNLDPSDGFGEFCIKDPDYRDAVLEKLAAVL